MSVKYVFVVMALFFSLASVSGQSNENARISIHHDHVPLKEVFGDITRKTGFVFTYGNLDDSQTVSIHCEQKALKEVLSQLCFQIQAEWNLRDKYIIVKRKSDSYPRERELTGVVKDRQTGLPISRASIYVKSAKTLINTNQDGQFIMKLKTDKQWLTLSVAKMNYKDTTVVVGLSHDGPVNVYLKGFTSRSVEELYPLDRKEVSVNPSDSLLPDSIVLLANQKRNGFWESLEIEKPDFSNIKEELFSTVSFSLLPPISTNKMLDYHTANNISINIIGGHSAGVNGLELGGVYNYTKGDVNGLQATGIVNRVKGNATGIQLAGILNSNSGKTTGVQASGVVNYSADSLSGLQIAGFYQKANWMMGMQAAGFYNQADTIIGAQIAGFYNQAKVIKGAQISGFLNYTDTLEGVQIGLINISKYTKSGLGIGLFNFVGNGYHKIEIARNSEQTWQLGFRSGWSSLYLHYFGGINHQRKDTTFLQAGMGLASSLKLTGKLGFEIEANVRTQRVAQQFEEWAFNFHNQALIGLSWQPFKKLGVKAGLTLNHFWYDANDAANQSYLSLTSKSIYDYKGSDYSHQLWWGWQISVLFF